MSVLDKLKALDDQRAKLLDDAKKEALEAAHKAIADLNALGFYYRLVEGPAHRKQESRPVSVPRVKLQNVKRETCPAQSANLRPSLIMTVGPIAPTEPKRPFTEKELVGEGA